MDFKGIEYEDVYWIVFRMRPNEEREANYQQSGMSHLFSFHFHNLNSASTEQSDFT